MKAYILKEKIKDKYFTFELSWPKTYNIKSVKYDKCFKTKQMAERYLSQMTDKWKNELYIVKVEIQEIKESMK